ncbi:heme lyase CcmF/NrfE family subunit [Asticcacaulis sp. ZE23SCel15]|uniref:heme lyase CcmF/NrfE family subunit n=1 Tax=Asticcacaulis sp. ZE23SCel15 TaxID=3059027 RepID=UPI00265E0766|nr:heme lyase CcmF/NrfE family subunit [Asticcacaulis sp. ZE23SCel15]WKL57702.1 heme lyase CcmF/NrfE family subunit [Asticcacaulis sp. ZE23SCel15]
MIAELGTFCLTLAFVLSVAQALVMPVSRLKLFAGFARLSEGLSLSAAVAMALSFAALLYAFLTSDFSVANVAANSHTSKPLLYKISGAWGSHEGSMLLWCLILLTFSAMVTLLGAGLPDSLKHKVLAVQGVLGAMFTGFTLFSSNPLARVYPAPFEGKSLNPMLQDPALAFHPPLLYLGYVGFSVVFSFAVAALIEGKIDRAWARYVRPWTLLAWSFLTVGITLGSFWAYYELGWGGWWFWDPVENASLMPWLAGTALLHAAIVMEKRDALKAWTVFLALLAFTFSMMGAFLVRSGVLTSVHAFAVDPQRGILLLIILFVTSGFGFALYALRSRALGSSGVFAPVSRESALVVNNLLLFAALSSVCLGTLYPLLMEATTGKTISVGEPYYLLTFGPIIGAALLLAPLAMLLSWKRADLKGVMQRLAAAFGVSVVCAVIATLGVKGIDVGGRVVFILGLLLGFWLIFGSFKMLAERVGLFKGTMGESRRRFMGLALGTHGMILAHIGLGVFVLGATFEGHARLSTAASLSAGASLTVGGYEVIFEGIRSSDGPNFLAEAADLTVRRKGGQPVCDAAPERRFYPASRQTMSEVAICFTPLNDLYFVLGESSVNAAGQPQWQVRALYNPWVRLIFVGPLLMALGGILSLLDRRLRLGVATSSKALKEGGA